MFISFTNSECMLLARCLLREKTRYELKARAMVNFEASEAYRQIASDCERLHRKFAKILPDLDEAKG